MKSDMASIFLITCQNAFAAEGDSGLKLRGKLGFGESEPPSLWNDSRVFTPNEFTLFRYSGIFREPAPG